jgi:Skp family chaperone for outer membrane proteins
MRVSGLAAATVVVAAAFAVSPTAEAQRNRGGGVVVIDYQRVVNESQAGRDMGAKLQQIQAQVGTEAQSLAPERQSIAQEQQRLQRQRGNRTEEQVRNDATLRPQYEQLAQRISQFQTRENMLRGDYECSQFVALRELTDNLVMPVVQTIMRTRNASVAVDKASTFYVAPENDITQTVIDQLNQNPATRTVNVTRRPVAECVQQQQAAQAAAPAR